ncbi:MAG: glycosyltransferase [Planctomycetota bacterium]
MRERPRLVVAVTTSQSVVLLRGQLAFLRERGFDAYLLCGGDHTARKFCEREGARFLEVRMRREMSPFSDPPALLRIVRILRCTRPALVNAGTPKAGLLARARELRLFPEGKGKVLGEGSSNGVDIIRFALLVVGPFEGGDSIPGDARRVLESDPRIHLTGPVTDVPAAYAAMNVLAVPTYREGFCNVFIEAAAMEVPAVGTRVVGCVDAVVDGVTGTLVPPRAPEALARAIRAYLDRPELAARHGREGRERAVRKVCPFPSEDCCRAGLPVAGRAARGPRGPGAG